MPDVIAIGGGNGERVLAVAPESYMPGKKHAVSPVEVRVGGSAVNAACRLLAEGTSVVPIIPLADDYPGRLIKGLIADTARAGGAIASLNDLFMSCPDGIDPNELRTAFSTILSVGAQRTIMTESSDALITAFPANCREVLPHVLDSLPRAALIGHLHADREKAPGLAGKLTEEIIGVLAETGVGIFANFGGSQFRLGQARWLDCLTNLSCFQLDIQEMRQFFGGTASLAEMLAGSPTNARSSSPWSGSARWDV